MSCLRAAGFLLMADSGGYLAFGPMPGGVRFVEMNDLESVNVTEQVRELAGQIELQIGAAK